MPTGYYFQKESTLKKAEIEIVTNIINGQWRAAYANYEHEKIGEEQGHLDPERVKALIARLPTSFPDPLAQVVYELASALAAQRLLPGGLYKSLLNTFAVPVPGNHLNEDKKQPDSAQWR